MTLACLLVSAVAAELGAPEIFPKPGGDVALSPDGALFVNGHGQKGKNYYSILRRSDSAWVRSPAFDPGGYVGGDLRLATPARSGTATAPNCWCPA